LMTAFGLPAAVAALNITSIHIPCSCLLNTSFIPNCTKQFLRFCVSQLCIIATVRELPDDDYNA
jgi:hypothetical protein